MRAVEHAARFCLTLALATQVFAPRVEAQKVHIDVRAGALSLAEAGERTLRPRVVLAVGVPLIGPLEASGRVSATAEAIPLLHPGFGFATGLALRPEFRRSRLAPLLEVYAGRTQLSGVQGRVSAWTLDAAAGLGLRVGGGVSLEARAERHLFFGVPADVLLADRAWAGSLGLAVDW